MSEKVSIYGPNIGSGGEMHVHREGCADTKRGEYLRTDPPWHLDATSKKHVVENVYSDIIAESPGSTWKDYASEIRFFPCTNLPADETEAEPEIVTVTVEVQIAVDTTAWARTYGQPVDEAEKDATEHLRELVTQTAETAVARLGAGAQVVT